MSVTKIISGGQTGADMGGLLAGRELGIETGGTAPKGWRTEDGPNILLHCFGLVQAPTNGYQYRTLMNIKNSDGTVIFSQNQKSAGTVLTITKAEDLGKPYTVNPGIIFFFKWLLEHNIQVLNVAGNRESVSPGIETKVKDYLILALGEGND